MKILQSFLIVLLAFTALSFALVIDKRSADIVIEDQYYLPSKTYHYYNQKRDVNELHNTGNTKTTTTATKTTTATSTSKPTRTPAPTSSPSTNPGKQ